MKKFLLAALVLTLALSVNTASALSKRTQTFGTEKMESAIESAANGRFTPSLIYLNNSVFAYGSGYGFTSETGWSGYWTSIANGATPSGSLDCEVTITYREGIHPTKNEEVELIYYFTDSLSGQTYYKTNTLTFLGFDQYTQITAFTFDSVTPL